MGKKAANDITLNLTHGSFNFHSFSLLSFVAIVAFSTLFHIYVVYTSKNGKLRNDVLLEEIVKSFSIIGEFKFLILKFS